MPSLKDSGYGVTAQGFNRPNLSVLMARAEELFKSQSAFGSDFSFESDKVLYQLSSVFNMQLTDICEVLEQNYNNSTPLKAEGVPLFQKGSFVGITRKQASYAVGEVTFTGENDVEIPRGFDISTTDGIRFFTLQSGIIKSGTITIPIQALTSGFGGNVGANTITEFVTPIPGLVGVTNAKLMSKGDNQETESEFRKRYFDSVEEGTGNNVDAIASALKTLAGVRDARVVENETDATVDGIPPHSIAPFVWGGDDSDIAQLIFDKKAGGPRSFGSTTIEVADTQSQKHPIGFTRPTNIDIYVKLKIVKGTGYPSDGDTSINNTIVSYINSLGLGANVYPFKMVCLITNLQFEGIENIIVEVSKSSTGYSANPIAIDKDEVPITSTDKVAIVNAY